MPHPRRRRRALGLLLAPVATAGLLATPPAGVAAATTTASSLGQTLQAVDLPTYPGFLTLGGRGVSYDTPTKTGMVVSGLGFDQGGAPPADQQAAVFATYGGSELIGRSTRIVAPIAVAAGFTEDGDGTPPLRLATLHRTETGRVLFDLTAGQEQGFAVGTERIGPVSDTATSLSFTQVRGDAATGGDEPVIITGGSDGLHAYRIPPGFAPADVASRLGTAEATLEVLDLHNDASSDPSGDTSLRGLARNGPTTVLYRQIGTDAKERVVRGFVSVTKRLDGGLVKYAIGLTGQRVLDVPQGKVIAGQTRPTDALGSGWVTAVRVEAADGSQRNVLLEANGTTADIGDLCAGDGPPGVAVLPRRGVDPLSRTTVACTAVVEGAAADQLRVAVVETRTGASPQPAPVSVSVPVAGLPQLDPTVVPVPLLDLPAVSLYRAHPEATRPTSGAPAERLAVRALLRGGTAGPQERIAVANASFIEVVPGGYDVARPTTFTLPAGDGRTATGPLLGVPLDAQRMKVDLTMTKVEDTAANPVPLAFVQAPPTVRGAQQGSGSSATYGKTIESSTSKGTSTATRIGASLGIEWEDPAGFYGVAVEGSYTREVEQSYESSRTVSTTESYTGAPEQDNVVYRSDNLRRYTGTVVGSSLGVALGTVAEIDLPLASVVSVAPVPTLRARFPEFAAGGVWAPALAAAFPHRAGDPGSYMAHDDGQVIDDYCDGTRSGGPSAREVTPPAAYTPVNPFVDRAPAAPGPDILVGERHSQRPGTGVVEGTDITISEEQAQAFVSSHSFDVSASFKAGYVKGTVTAGATWAQDWSSSLSSGQSFSAQVASVPSADLADEGYDWRMFVCRKTLPGPGGAPFPAFVQGFLVDNYRGSGGLQEMSPVELVSPIESQVVDKDDVRLTFRQAAGSVKQHAYRIEAVGRNQVMTGTVRSYANPRAGTPDGAGDGDLDGIDGRPDVLVLDPPPTGLLPNQLYRWRVAATDFFGNVVTSDYEFFTVDGPPRAALGASTLTPDAGAPVTLTNSSYITNLADRVTCTYDFGDGTRLVEQDVAACRDQVEHTWRSSGTFQVVLTVCVRAGCGSDSLLITVNGTAVDDAYEVLEDSTNLAGQLPSVLANDGARTATLLSQTSHGALDLRTDGTFRYVPDRDFCGRDMFSYIVDGNSTRSATAVITVVCQQDAPRPGDDEHQAVEDTVLLVEAPGLLRNDVDPDGTPEQPVVLRTTLAAEPAKGTVEVAPDGSFRYSPARDTCGTDAFRYAVSDGIDTAEALVRVIVACVNDAPSAVSDQLTVDEDSSTLLAVTANDTDPDGDALNALFVSVPGHGVADGEGAGVRYQPAKDFCGTDAFTYRAGDPSGALSAPVSVTVTVVCRNDAPVAAEDVFVRKSGSRPHTEPAPGVLANDRDNDSGSLTAVLHSRPTSGDLVLHPDGSFVYTPRSSNQGGDSFYYRAFDGAEYSAPVRVVVTVTQGGSGK